MHHINRFLQKNLIYLILLLATLALSNGINKPFISHHDWNGAFWGTITRNWTGHLQKLLGLPTVFDGVNKGSPLYYSNYPPLMPALFALSSFVFGINEISLRLVTVTASLLLIFSLYNIGKLLYSKEVGLVTAVLALATPMFLYFGKLPDHEPIVTSLISVALYWYLRARTGNRRDYFLFLIFFTLALLESWAPYFLLPFLWLDTRLFTHSKRPASKSLLFIMGTVIAGQLLLITRIQGTAGIITFVRSGLFRINGQGPASIITFTWRIFFTTVAHYAVIYFTRVLLLLSGIWVIKTVLGTLKRQISASDRTVFLLFLLPPLSFVLVFRNLVYIHDYKLYLLLPFVTLAAAAMTMALVNKLQKLTQKRGQLISHTTSFLLLVGIIVFTFTERLPFLTTLQATSFNTPGVELGRLISTMTEPLESTWVNSGEFMSFFDVFVRYYGNRHIVGGDITLADFQNNPITYNNFRYIVLINKRPTDPDFAAYLNQNFQVYTQGEFMLFDLQRPRL